MDYVIIVAGGKGLRMGSEIPKQFLPVAGKPILMRTIERFHEYDPALNIILVLPESQQAYWHQLCEEHHFDIEHQIANGGDTRFQSSKNGLALIPDNEDGVVGIHDGVRPFVSKEVIEECFETAREEYAAIPVYAVTDTLRYIDQHGGGKTCCAATTAWCRLHRPSTSVWQSRLSTRNIRNSLPMMLRW